MKKKSAAFFPANCWCIFFWIVLVVTSFQASAQMHRVAGTVLDSKSLPLAGVTVSIKGGGAGITTDSSGRYAIDVPSSASVLVFSYVGYVTKEEKVGNSQTINITLVNKVNDLDEVVVVGYGQTQKKSNLTGSISSVNSKQIQERQPINIYDALQGQAAGVLIMNDSGEPGAEGSVTIRGNNTFAAEGNKPLWIIDGVLTDNPNAINPNDIERIEVLKDAASASIYGARSAAGVILITTKRGKEGKTKFDLQYSKIFGELAHKLQVANAAELRYYRKIQAGTINGTQGTFTDSLNPSFNSDNDLQDLLLGNLGNRDDIKIGILLTCKGKIG